LFLAARVGVEQPNRATSFVSGLDISRADQASKTIDGFSR